MAQLRLDYEKFVAQETVIVVIGPEAAPAFADYWQKHELPFMGLPDPTHTVLKKYGQEVNLFKLGRMPAQVIIDQQGIVRFVYYGHDMSDIPTNAEILDVLEALNSMKSGE